MVPLAPGSNVLTIALADVNGRTDTSALELTVERRVPFLALEAAFPASATSWFLLDALSGLVEHDPTSGLAIVHSAPTDAGFPDGSDTIAAMRLPTAADQVYVQSRTDGVLRCFDVGTST
ncbi:MAG: hypothetical protein EXS13_13195 [Planctomycetes bacterium]|nr:hypothetical protein [Planctomycetota bacterium]